MEMQSNYLFDPEKNIVNSSSERLYEAANNFNLSKFNINPEEFKKIVYDSNNLSLHKRLIYGLPISYEEYGHLTILQSTLSNGYNIDFVKKLQRKYKK